MKRHWQMILTLFLLVVFLSACSPSKASNSQPAPTKTMVVTYSVLASLVSDLVREHFQVVTLIPNGLDPHEWEPAAQDIAALQHASLIICNGLGLEGGLEESLKEANRSGVPIFTAADHIVVRTVQPGQGIPDGDADQAPGAKDPHFWLDPIALKNVITSLASEIKGRFGINLLQKANQISAQLDVLDLSIQQTTAQLSKEQRLIITGHESLGYFADRYGFTLIGAIVPSLNSQAEVSAAELQNLKSLAKNKSIKVIFTELGTSPKVAETLANDLHISTLAIETHRLPDDGQYSTMMLKLTQQIVVALQ